MVFDTRCKNIRSTQNEIDVRDSSRLHRPELCRKIRNKAAHEYELIDDPRGEPEVAVECASYQRKQSARVDYVKGHRRRTLTAGGAPRRGFAVRWMGR